MPCGHWQGNAKAANHALSPTLHGHWQGHFPMSASGTLKVCSKLLCMLDSPPMVPLIQHETAGNGSQLHRGMQGLRPGCSGGQGKSARTGSFCSATSCTIWS